MSASVRPPTRRPTWTARRGAGIARRSTLLEGPAGEVGDELRRCGVEPDDVEHPRICRIGDREAVRDHAHDNEPGVDARSVPVVAQSLDGMHLTRPRLRV